MKKIITIVACLFMASLQASFAQDQLRLNQSQIDNLGIITQEATRVTSVWSRVLPGKIVIPNAQIRVLNPMLPGLVNILYVAEGDQISKDQKLAEISSPAFLSAQQDYLEALSNQTLMTRNHQRNEELMKEGIISEKSYLSGQAALQEAEASLYRSYQSLQFSGLGENEIIELKKTRQMKRTMVIPAPFDGVVLEQTAKTGEHVDEDVSLYQVGQIDPLWVEIHVPYMMRNSLQIGNKITLEGSDVQSNIITIGQMVHDDDQGIIVRGLLEQGQNQFIPGQFVKAHLEQKTEQGDFYRIPTGAVIRSGDDVTLFIRDASGFSLKPARIIADEGQSLVIDAAISTGDMVAIKGLATLKGMLEGLGSDD